LCFGEETGFPESLCSLSAINRDLIYADTGKCLSLGANACYGMPESGSRVLQRWSFRSVFKGNGMECSMKRSVTLGPALFSAPERRWIFSAQRKHRLRRFSMRQFFLRKIWSLPLVGAADIEEFGRVTSTSLPACRILQFAVAMEIPKVISITPPPIFLYDRSQQHRTKEQPRYSLRSIFKDRPVQNLRRFACPSPLRQFFPECPG